MFYYIKGTVAHTEQNLVVVEAGGVGYALNTSYASATAVKKGDAAKFFTYLHVREDIFELFGFATEEELNCFKMLIAISGVGPKAALAILSVVTPSKLALCVISDDEKALTRAQGVGKKLAQRIILELKDKMAKANLGGAELNGADFVMPEAGSGAAGEAIAALNVLGYTRAEAAEALKGLDAEGLPVEELVRLCLKKLMR